MIIRQHRQVYAIQQKKIEQVVLGRIMAKQVNINTEIKTRTEMGCSGFI